MMLIYIVYIQYLQACFCIMSIETAEVAFSAVGNVLEHCRGSYAFAQDLRAFFHKGFVPKPLVDERLQ